MVKKAKYLFEENEELNQKQNRLQKGFYVIGFFGFLILLLAGCVSSSEQNQNNNGGIFITNFASEEYQSGVSFCQNYTLGFAYNDVKNLGACVKSNINDNNAEPEIWWDLTYNKEYFSWEFKNYEDETNAFERRCRFTMKDVPRELHITHFGWQVNEEHTKAVCYYKGVPYSEMMYINFLKKTRNVWEIYDSLDIVSEVINDFNSPLLVDFSEKNFDENGNIIWQSMRG